MKVLVLGAGGAASNGFARALRLAGGYELVGTNASETDLLLSECETNYLVPPVSDTNGWRRAIHRIVLHECPDFAHAQSDVEVEAVARFRNTITTRTFLPATETIRVCRDKWLSYEKWRDAGITVPETMVASDPGSVFELTTAKGQDAWVRPRVGAGGQKSLRGGYLDVIRWLNKHQGFGDFTIADCLTPDTVTVQQLYWRGDLVCSQQRTRESWANAASTTTGVSGSTGVGVTTSDPEADRVADAAVAAVDECPHGLFGVDMARNTDGVPCPTEINIGRFFTTAPEFFAMAGWNMAQIYMDFGTDAVFADITMEHEKVPGGRNRIADGYKWVRGMDSLPVLVPPAPKLDWAVDWARATFAA